MPYLVLGVAILIGLVFAARWASQADPRRLAVALRWGVVVTGAAFTILFIESGLLRLVPVSLLFAASPWIVRSYLRHKSAPPPGTAGSVVETRFLRMRLDHASGGLSGDVTGGPYGGRALADLSQDELLALWRLCEAEDGESARLLTTYLDRMHPAWRQWGAAAPGQPGVMSAEEAREILGVAVGAAADDVESAYRRLMLKLHPDQGGSDYLAAKINQARDVLLQG